MKNKKLKQLISTVMITTAITTAIPAFINTTPVYALTTMTEEEANTAYLSRTLINGGTEYQIDGYSGPTTAPVTITIPDQIGGINVTKIKNHAFVMCYALKSITIPSSVTAIGDYAFSDCDNLESITIPNSVTTIGGWAFCACNKLESITLSNSVTTIGYDTFSGCPLLKSITIPNSITTLRNGAFLNCSALESITLSDSLTTIEPYAFDNINSNAVFYAPNEAVAVLINPFITGSKKKVKAILTLNSRTDTSTFVSFPKQTGATSVKIQQSIDGGTTWTDVLTESLTDASESATITGLSPYTSYKFRLFLNGNSAGGILNVPAVAKLVTDVSYIDNIHVPFGTAKSAYNLPSAVNIKLNDSTTTDAAVTWDNGISISDGTSAYNGNVAGTYTFSGTLDFPAGIMNPLNLKATVNVIVGAPVVIPPTSEIQPTTTSASATIKGTERVGKTLEAVLLTDNGAEFTTSAAVTYEWYRLSERNSSNGDPIGDNNTYKLVSSDKGKYIKVIVTYDGDTFEDITSETIKKKSSSNTSSSSSPSINSTDEQAIAIIYNSTIDEAAIINAINNENIKTVIINYNNATGIDSIYQDSAKLAGNTPLLSENVLNALKANTYKTLIIKSETTTFVIKVISDGQIQITQNNVLLTGFKVICNGEYYFNNNGVIQTGWLKFPGDTWYHLNTVTGVKEKGWIQDTNGKWYYLDIISGIMKTGWLNINNTKYFLNSDGSMEIGWLKDSDGKWYYFYENGAMAINTTIDGYYVNESGVWDK